MTDRFYLWVVVVCLAFSAWAAGIHPSPVLDPSFDPANATRFEP